MRTEHQPKQAKQVITKRTDDYSAWYHDVIETANLAEYGPVRGTIVFKPYGYAIWELIQRALDERIKAHGVANVYFPLFIPESFLKREAKHVEGFSPEVAAVLYAGGQRLKEALIVRPTSESIIYPILAGWVHSHQDLPILINQWANVVRWEKRPRLFLRTTEFLWQEGHTVHATPDEAEHWAHAMLDLYKIFAEQFLAIPVIAGVKTQSEKFAGALRTYTIEAMMQDGKALQIATSHNLGQNFSKVFDIQFTDIHNVSQHAWQTSWGLSTRVIGALIMAHSDDTGLVLPPTVAPIQVVIVPIWYGDDQKITILEEARTVAHRLRGAGVRGVHIDERDLHAGAKFFEWERKGVPLRIELGPKDVARKSLVLVRRDTGKKEAVPFDAVSRVTTDRLASIQTNLYERALKYRDRRTRAVDTWGNFVKAIREGGFVLAHWSGDLEVEKKIKEETSATIRCIPLDAKHETGRCVYSKKTSQQRVVFAKAY